MIQTQSQNEEIEQITHIGYKVHDKVWGKFWYHVKDEVTYEARCQVSNEVWGEVAYGVGFRVWSKVRRELFL